MKCVAFCVLQSGLLEVVTKEVEILRLKDKELGRENKKLRGIIKTGVDALKEEQELVKTLRTRLASKSQVN